MGAVGSYVQEQEGTTDRSLAGLETAPAVGGYSSEVVRVVPGLLKIPGPLKSRVEEDSRRSEEGLEEASRAVHQNCSTPPPTPATDPHSTVVPQDKTGHERPFLLGLPWFVQISALFYWAAAMPHAASRLSRRDNPTSRQPLRLPQEQLTIEQY